MVMFRSRGPRAVCLRFGEEDGVGFWTSTWSQPEMKTFLRISDLEADGVKLVELESSLMTNQPIGSSVRHNNPANHFLKKSGE